MLTQALEWAESAAVGEYLAEYADDGLSDLTDSGNRCGYGDDELSVIGETLRERGLHLVADDTGLCAQKWEA